MMLRDSSFSESFTSDRSCFYSLSGNFLLTRLRVLSSLRGLRGAPEVPTLCRETSVSRTANVGTWLRKRNGGQKWVNDLDQLFSYVGFINVGSTS